MHRKMSAAGLPLNGTIEVTRRCPLTCAHCYNNLPMGDREARSASSTTTSTAVSSTSSLTPAASGCSIPAARSSGAATSSTSTRTRRRRVSDYPVHERHADHRTASRTPGRVASVRDRDHALRPHQGDLRAAHRHSGLVREVHAWHPAPARPRAAARLKTVAVSTNRHEIPAMQRFVEDELGVRFKFDSMINPRVDCSRARSTCGSLRKNASPFDLADRSAATSGSSLRTVAAPSRRSR